MPSVCKCFYVTLGLGGSISAPAMEPHNGDGLRPAARGRGGGGPLAGSHRQLRAASSDGEAGSWHPWVLLEVHRLSGDTRASPATPPAIFFKAKGFMGTLYSRFEARV